jgi:DNA-binding transcriptional LysR family regulator
MDLRVVKAIVEEGSISKAANKLDYVQSNITARVQKLELELGVSLFHRHPKGVTPTEKGHLLSKYAHDILRMTQEAAMAVKEPDHPSGELKVGVVETVTSSPLFIQGLTHFQQRYPDVTISLITGTSPQNYDRLINRELDGAFCTGDLSVSKLEIEMIIEDTVMLLTKKTENAPFKFKNAPSATWIVFPKGCPFRATIEKWVHQDRGEKANVIEVSTTETMLNCVRSGLGYALMPNSVLAKDDTICTHEIPEQYRYATTRLIRRSEKFQSKSLIAFTHCLKEVGFS